MIKGGFLVFHIDTFIYTQDEQKKPQLSLKIMTELFYYTGRIKLEEETVHDTIITF